MEEERKHIKSRGENQLNILAISNINNSNAPGVNNNKRKANTRTNSQEAALKIKVKNMEIYTKPKQSMGYATQRDH